MDTQERIPSLQRCYLNCIYVLVILDNGGWTKYNFEYVLDGSSRIHCLKQKRKLIQQLGVDQKYCSMFVDDGDS